MKQLTVAGCSLWIIGLTVFIVGLNLNGAVKDWLTVIGSVVFLVGLGLSGIVWARKKKEQ